MISNAIILMTALPPTKGHQQLIQFASDFIRSRPGPGTGIVTVLVCSRPQEPLEGYYRYMAISQHFKNDPTVRVKLYDKDAPQNPEDHPDFWNVWKSIILQHADITPGDYVIASEAYGAKVAEALGCRYIPFNISRDTVTISATKFRNDPVSYFEYLMDEIQPLFRKTVTMFGAESTGKTKMAKTMTSWLHGYFVPEWAREYMENFEPKVTMPVMETITHAQYASQKAAQRLYGKPFIFQDTDLLSTIGYYRIYCPSEQEPDDVVELFQETKSDLYVVMNSKIPYEPDPLRFGGDHRESTDQFWIDLLEEFDCKYYVVEPSNFISAANDVMKACVMEFWDHPLYSYARD